MPEGASSQLDIAVAGAGIGGLTAAISLARCGFNVVVHEKAAELQEIGAGIQLSPNAMHVLRRLDLEDAVLQCATEPNAIDIRIAKDGRHLASINLKDECRPRYGAPYVVIHRADLLEILLTRAREQQSISITTGSEVSSIAPNKETVQFTARAVQHTADLLIAADGVHSDIRRALTGQQVMDLSQTAWRATLRDPWSDDIMPGDRTGLWLGKGVHLVHYGLRGGHQLNLVLISHAGTGNAVDLLHGFNEPVRKCVADAHWLPWPLLQIDPAGDWVRGRVALLGDAAHAMLPTSAQGGAQAIEDAFMIAACLAGTPDNPASALSIWQNRRRARVKRIATQAADNLRIYGLSGLAASARNLAIRTLPSRFHLARLDWLYGWQPDANLRD